MKKINEIVNIDSLDVAFDDFIGAFPFNHCVIDDFFNHDIASELSLEFPDFNDSSWHQYSNSIEEKKACNDWNKFPKLTYQIFQLLNSQEFIEYLSDKLGVRLFPDNGLNGGGWHIHANGGNLNPHFDYSIHPKLGLQRKVNIIIYLSKELEPSMGGQLGLWEHNELEMAPSTLVKEVNPIFNRAVIFDTTQNSWHGMSKELNCPDNVYRKSLACYYLCEPKDDALKHQKALFAPRDHQKNDQKVIDLIKKRADVHQSSSTYRDE